MYNLPRPYISYSQYSLWKSSKDQYRKRYYEDAPSIETIETLYGKKIGLMVEEEKHHDDEVLSKLINYPCKEYRIEVEIDEGLKVLGFLDQFHPETLSLLEMKTGHRNKAGKAPWDNLKVHKHKQLVFYSLLIELKHGDVHPTAILQWLETEFADETIEFDGHILTSKSGRKLFLNGAIETYERVIEQWERDKIREDIIMVAKEITEDYTQWQKTK